MAIHANSTPVPARPLLGGAPRPERPVTTNYRRVSAALRALIDGGFVMGCNIDATWSHVDGRTASFCHEGRGAFVTIWPARWNERLLPSAEPRQQLGLGVLVLPMSGLTLAHAAPGVFLFKGGRDA